MGSETIEAGDGVYSMGLQTPKNPTETRNRVITISAEGDRLAPKSRLNTGLFDGDRVIIGTGCGFASHRFRSVLSQDIANP